MSGETVIGIGELLWDLFPEGRQLGGAPANFAYHAHALGASGIPVSCVGTDDLGTDALDRLRANGLGTDYVYRDEQHSTGTVSVELDGRGVPHYTICEDVAWDFLQEDYALRELARTADAVCFGSLAQRAPTTRGTIRAFLQALRPSCVRIFDINLRQQYFDETILRDSLEQADVLKLNDDELSVLRGMFGLSDDEPRMLRELLSRFSLRVIALTRGERGAFMLTAEEEAVQAAVPVEGSADTVGAGDAFAASMAVGLLRHHDLARICSDANQRASYVCSQAGAMPPMPKTQLSS